jgi:heat shock protein HspQ
MKILGSKLPPTKFKKGDKVRHKYFPAFRGVVVRYVTVFISERVELCITTTEPFWTAMIGQLYTYFDDFWEKE